MSDRACTVIVQNGCLLLVRQTYRGNLLWTFPGGKIEPGEAPEEAAIREVKEETGLDVAIKHLLYQGVRLTGDGLYYCYLGEITGGEVTLGCDPELPPNAQELYKICWFPIQAVKEHIEAVEARCKVYDL